MVISETDNYDNGAWYLPQHVVTSPSSIVILSDQISTCFQLNEDESASAQNSVYCGWNFWPRFNPYSVLNWDINSLFQGYCVWPWDDRWLDKQRTLMFLHNLSNEITSGWEESSYQSQPAWDQTDFHGKINAGKCCGIQISSWCKIWPHATRSNIRRAKVNTILIRTAIFWTSGFFHFTESILYLFYPAQRECDFPTGDPTSARKTQILIVVAL